MPTGPHFHHFHIVLKSTISEEYVQEPDKRETREIATIYKQCDCGCINKERQLVTHQEGRSWDDY